MLPSSNHMSDRAVLATGIAGFGTSSTRLRFFGEWFAVASDMSTLTRCEDSRKIQGMDYGGGETSYTKIPDSQDKYIRALRRVPLHKMYHAGKLFKFNIRISVLIDISPIHLHIDTYCKFKLIEGNHDSRGMCMTHSMSTACASYHRTSNRITAESEKYWYVHF